jgi:hypothetical protein
MTSDTKTCDACGKRYAFTSYKDRCPVCCPVEDKDSESSEEYDQTDYSDPAERKRDSQGRVHSNKKRRPEGRHVNDGTDATLRSR